VQVASQSFGGVTGAGSSDPSADRRRPRSSAYKFAPGPSRSTTSPPPQGARNRTSCRCLLPWYVVFWTRARGLGLQFLFLSFPVLSLISLIRARLVSSNFRIWHYAKRRFSITSNLRYMHRVLNVDENKKLIAQFGCTLRDERFEPN